MSAEKLCIICGEDCAGRPRLKDSKGQYACQACVEAKKRPRPAPKAKAPSVPVAVAPPAGDDAGFGMDQFLGDVRPADANPCPKCGMGRPEDAVVCMQCGFDSASGRGMSTKVSKEKVKRARRTPRLSGGKAYVVIALSMLVLLPALAIFSPVAGFIGLGIAFLWYVVSYAYMVGAAFRDDDRFWGFLGVLFWLPLAGQFCWLAFVLYYCTIGSQRGVRKLNFWAAFFTIWIIVGIFYTYDLDSLPGASPASEP